MNEETESLLELIQELKSSSEFQSFPFDVCEGALNGDLQASIELDAMLRISHL
jgi:hypothetical protein